MSLSIFKFSTNPALLPNNLHYINTKLHVYLLLLNLLNFTSFFNAVTLYLAKVSWRRKSKMPCNSTNTSNVKGDDIFSWISFLTSPNILYFETIASNYALSIGTLTRRIRNICSTKRYYNTWNHEISKIPVGNAREYLLDGYLNYNT